MHHSHLVLPGLDALVVLVARREVVAVRHLRGDIDRRQIRHVARLQALAAHRLRGDALLLQVLAEALSARSLLALFFEECNPDASDDRAAYLVRRGAGHCDLIAESHDGLAELWTARGAVSHAVRVGAEVRDELLELRRV